MQFPISTGQVCDLLNVRESRLDGLVRQRKVKPETVCGRRLWQPAEVLRAAHILGVDSIEIKNALRAAQNGGSK
jgi:hypothetical protein